MWKFFLRLFSHLFVFLKHVSVCRFVMSLAEVDAQLMMNGESLLWTSHDSVFVLQHGKESIDLR